MAGYHWTKTKPSSAGWYWFRGLAHEADFFINHFGTVALRWPARLGHQDNTA